MNTTNNQVRLVTINTWKCDGDYFTRMKVLSRQLRYLAADVIICQECFETLDGAISTAAYLAAELGMQYALTRARPRIRKVAGYEVHSFSGLGILSSLPLRLVESIELPTSVADGGRNAQFVAADLGNGHETLIANIHLTFLKHAETLRSQQLEVIGKSMLAYDQYAFRIIAGDFNAEIDAPEIIRFMQNTAAVDCYASGSGTEPRDTARKKNHVQSLRWVDHLFALPASTKDQYPAFIDSKIVLDSPDPDTGLHPSDHFGVATTLLF